MSLSDKKSDRVVTTVACISPGSGWSATVMLSDSECNRLAEDDWKRILCSPQSMTEDSEKVLKSDGSTVVAVKNLKFTNKDLPVVIKYERVSKGFKGFFRSLLPAKAILNFNTATMLWRKDIPAVRPLAALQKKKGIFTTTSIYITEYSPGSENLHSFLLDREMKTGSDQALKNSLSIQVADILAGLHNNGLWHRDSKAGNFLVTTSADGSQPKLALVDMDGIKAYMFSRYNCRIRSLSKLASTLLWCGSLYSTDYMRCFSRYCRLTKLDGTKRRIAMRTISAKAIAMRMLTMAREAMSSS
ncbi:MAG TPA: hypothetical protein ENH94_00910 [Phycisphaerales bacterium]|nr:hypothetical protein [Phycisphaerales bacterium]